MTSAAADEPASVAPLGEGGEAGEVARLRARRWVLRADLTATARWRRLLHAKAELTIARGTLPPLPGELVAALEDPPDLPVPAGALVAACTVPAAGFLMSDLLVLRDLDARLAHHEDAVRTDLMRTTDELVEALTEGAGKW